jgi:hypothetical protein
VELGVLCVKSWLEKEQKSLLQIRMGQQLKRLKASCQVRVIEVITDNAANLLPTVRNKTFDKSKLFTFGCFIYNTETQYRTLYYVGSIR